MGRRGQAPALDLPPAHRRGPDHRGGAVLISADLLDRHQVAGYLGTLAIGVTVELLAPGSGPVFAALLPVVLALLLFVTFLQVPMADLAAAARPGRFPSALLLVNLIAAPVVVALLLPWVPAQDGLRLGVALVLLAPCVDYVVTFTGLAGGDRAALLAMTPLLLIGQLLLLPPLLLVLLGEQAVGVIRVGPFVTALVFMILLPLGAATLTRNAAVRHPVAAAAGRWGERGMVPLMMVTLFTVAAAEVPALDGRLGPVLRLVPIYLAFLAAMVTVGVLLTRALRVPVPLSRAATLSGATRNSLVVLPVALALPDAGASAPAAIVTQTLVEVAVLVLLVRILPRLLPERGPASST